MVSLVLTALLLVALAIGALVGFARGLSKSVIRLITLVIAIAITFVLAGPLSALVAENIVIEGQTLGQILLSSIASNEVISGIMEAAPLMEKAILASPTLIIAIVMFPLVFALLRFVTWIVFLCVQKPLRKLIFKEDGEKKEGMGAHIGKKFAGLGVGVVSGFLVFGMLFAPVFGMISVLPEKSALEEVLETLEENGDLDREQIEFIKSELAVLDSFAVNAYYYTGITPAGKAYLSSVSKIEYGDQVTHLTDEFDALFEVMQTAIEGGLISALMDTENKDAIYEVLSDNGFVNALMADMFHSKLLRSAVPEITALAIESAARQLKVPENDKEVYDNMIGDIADAVNNSGVDFESIKAYEEVNGISYVDSKNGNDPRTGIITEEEYNEQIKKLTALEDTIAKIVNKNVLGGSKETSKAVAEQFVSGVKEQVRKHGSEYVNNFDVESVKTTISEISSEGMNGSDVENVLDKMNDPDKFETSVATVEKIKENIRNTVSEAVKNDENASETANSLANVVSNLAGAVSDAMGEGGLDTSKLNFDKVAEAVGALQDSKGLKGVGSSVLDMVASGDLGSDALSDSIAGIKECYEKGDDIKEPIKFAGAAIELGTAMKDSNGEVGDKVINAFENLIENLSETTMAYLPNIINEDTIIGMGVPAKYASAAYSVLETLLNELMALKDADDYDSEVKAVLAIYTIATSGVDKIDSTDIKDLAGYAVSSDAIFNTLTSISTSNPFGIDIKTEQTRKDLVDAIEKGYDESGKTKREYDVYNAVATLLGLEAEVKLGK